MLLFVGKGTLCFLGTAAANGPDYKHISLTAVGLHILMPLFHKTLKILADSLVARGGRQASCNSLLFLWNHPAEE
jgi:hypothetical protein